VSVSFSSRRGLWALAAAAAVTSLAAAAAAAPSFAELQAREAYAAGRYQDALDLYVKLYADKLHPNYLRNIGRCYQNLAEPDKAIASFQDYLRKATDLAPAEREEIQGYIREMKQLKQEQQLAAGNGRPPRAPPAPRDLVAAAPPPPPPALVETAPPRPVPPPTPVYRRWWFWTAVGAAAAAAGTTVFLLTRSPHDPPCTLPNGCM
jgi:tetratricopeptide (TPR) repeat protein